MQVVQQLLLEPKAVDPVLAALVKNTPLGVQPPELVTLCNNSSRYIIKLDQTDLSPLPVVGTVHFGVRVVFHNFFNF